MNTLKAKYLLLFFFFFLEIIYAQKTQPSEDTRQACQQLIDDAWENVDSKDYAVALEKLLKAEMIAEENQWDDLLWYIKNSIGNVYLYLSSYAEALEYYQQSYVVTQQHKTLYKNSIQPLGNIGLLYFDEKNYDEALHYYLKAYDIIGEENALLKKHTAALLAKVYNITNQTEKSMQVLNDSKEDVDNSMVNFLWKEAYIDALFTNGEIIKAEKEAKQLYAEFGEINDDRYKEKQRSCYTCLVELLSKIYRELGEVDLAITYIKNGLRKADELPKRIEFYERISDLYLQKGQHYTALQYKDSVVQAKDSLSSFINRNLYEANKARFKVQEYQDDLIKEKERKKTQQNIFIGVAVLGLLVFILVYIVLKNNIIRQKQRAIISNLQLEKEREVYLSAEKELQINKLKQKQLKHEVSEKNRELAAKALYLTKRSKLIEDIIHSLETNNKKFADKEIGKHIRSIKNILKADDQQENFINHFERVNPDFLKQLKNKHPELTANDIRFLCYVYMNLDLKEISSIFNITYNACEIRKRRIKDKIGLGKDISLYDYIIAISK